MTSRYFECQIHLQQPVRDVVLNDALHQALNALPVTPAHPFVSSTVRPDHGLPTPATVFVAEVGVSPTLPPNWTQAWLEHVLAQAAHCGALRDLVPVRVGAVTLLAARSKPRP